LDEAAAIGITSIEGLNSVAEPAAWETFSAQAIRQLARTLADRGVALVPMLASAEADTRQMMGRPTEDYLADVPSQVRDAWTQRLTSVDRVPVDTMARALPTERQFLRVFARLGGKIVAGTGTGRPFVVPGLSLHREVASYVASGLSPAEALRTATINAAELLGLQQRAGTIAVGKDADLLLVRGDPIADVAALDRIALVIQGGDIIR
jgi:imidazolonepropionase-like amidohydrolase